MRLLAALLVLCPFAALSQAPEAAPVTPPPAVVPAAAPAAAAPTAAAPAWSIGGGVSLVASVWMSTPGVIAITNTPSADASLERRLGDRSWLVVGVSGTAFRFRQDIPPGGYGYSSDDARRLWLRAGVRRVVTPTGAPVDFSVLALGNVGAGWSRTTYEFPGSSETQSSLEWGAGVEVGIAADRALTDALSVRVATPLASVTWQADRGSVEGGPTIHGSSLLGNVGLAPRLELRMAF